MECDELIAKAWSNLYRTQVGGMVQLYDNALLIVFVFFRKKHFQ